MRLTVPFLDSTAAGRAPASVSRDAPAVLPETDSGSLRILHILRAPVGGLFRHVCDLVEEQTRMGHRVGIVCDASTGGAPAEAQLKRLLPWCRLGIERIPMSRTLSPGDVVTLAKIGRHVARIAPNVLHGHGAKGGAYARLLPRAKGRVALYTPHGGALHYSWRSPAGALFLGLERVLMSRSDGILFESHYGHRAYVEKVGQATCLTRVVPNGLAQADFAALPEGETIYDAVFVGELRTLKGVSTLIEAVAGISRDRPFRLAIAGTGPDETRFRAEVKAKGLEGQVDFLGHRPARDVFAMGRMIVVPSLAESFPYIVLEAAASGRPVIATDVGGIPEIFGPHSAELLPAGDAKALGQAIRAALDGSAAISDRAASLKERARKLFSAPRMAREVTRFYGDLAGIPALREWPVARPVKLPETEAV